MQTHALDAEVVLERLGTSVSGLSAQEAAARLLRDGPNRLPVAAGRSPLARFLAQFNNVLIYLLLAAAVVTSLLRHWVDTGVIIGVVVINALVGFIQEGKAERTLQAIRKLLSLRAMAMRGGRVLELPAEELVRGDVVIVQSGDRVPADLRLLHVKNLRVDEASLTGESMPVEKRPEPVADSAPIADRLCMAYSGTLVTFGRASGVVVATGAGTEIGRISALLQRERRLETPLLRRMRSFGGWLSLAILLLAALTFFFGAFIRGYPMQDMFLAAVGLAVAAIPEGLPAVITITLAIGVQRMARRHAIVRLLPAIEALGSVTTICSDKTGTLTRNEMTVQSIITREQAYTVTGVGYEPRGAFLADGVVVESAEVPTLAEALRAALLCNDATLRNEGGRWTIQGDPTEAALVVAAGKAGFDANVEQESTPRRDALPFESEQQFMASLHHDYAGHAFVYLKGAPERVLRMCHRERRQGADHALDRAYWQERVEQLAGRGQRVLALAFKPMAAGQSELCFDDVQDGMTFLGIVGMVDPPREEAIRAVARCQAAGIRVKMITGDHAATARVVAAQLGIGDGIRSATGAEIEGMDDTVLREVVTRTDVYARVSPEHKLRLVKALQSRGEVVAMTGDGVNDAPALKRADIGVAMGVTGTEVAKEAAEIVLADDSFASIANAVEEGRTVYDNLRKTILFMMPTNGGEAFTLIAAIALGLALPILPVQILWVNMVTAVTLSLALAFEPTEPGTMQRPPRDPRRPLFSLYFLWRTVMVSLVMVAGTLGMFLWEGAQGASVEAARTAAVNTLVLFEAVYLLSARYLFAPAWAKGAVWSNRVVPAMIVLVTAFQLLYTYAPFMQALFQSAPLAPSVWFRMILVALTVLVYVETEKVLLRKLKLRPA